MFKENYYTGEMQINSDQYISEAEAMQNAGFGQYAGQSISYGLGGNVYQNGPPQQSSGNPYLDYISQKGNPYMQQPSGYNSTPNYMQFYNQPQQQQQSKNMAYIPPVNLLGGEFIFPANLPEIIDDLAFKAMKDQAEFEGKQLAERAAAKQYYSYNNNYYNNYYGNPYYMQPQYNNNFVLNELEKIKDEAREANKKLNKHLLKLVYHYSGDDITDEQLEEMCSGKYVPMEQNVHTNAFNNITEEDIRFSNFIEYDPSEPYRRRDLEIQKQIQAILPPDTTLEQFGERCARLATMFEEEERAERRRNFSGDYNSNTYCTILRDRIAEKEANKRGFSLIKSELPNEVEKVIENIDNLKQARSSNISTEEEAAIMKNTLKEFGLNLLSDAVTVDKDGSIIVSANIGNAKGKQYISNEEEGHYADKKAMFAGFLDSIPRSEELHDRKIDEYNKFGKMKMDEFEYNITHPKPTTSNNGGGG